MKKYIHAGSVGFIINFISALSIFSLLFGSFVPVVSAMMIAPTFPTCCSSVAFIPGLEASRLYMPRLVPIFNENTLWEPNISLDVDKLDMDTNGKSIRDDVYTRDVIDKVGIDTGGLFDWTTSVYDSFIKYMDGLVADKVINSWEALPYDWRLGLGDVVSGGVVDATTGDISYLSSTTPDVSYMISQIQSLADHSITGKVTLVTHSNGGLVAKVLIQKLQDLKDQGQSNLIDKIDKVIMVAAPQLGAVDALGAILHGYNLNYVGGLVLNENHARAMAENMPGVYNLLPSQKYFENNIGPVITFATSTDTFSNLAKFYGRTISDYDSLKKFLIGADGRKDPSFDDAIDPNVLNKNLVDNAESQHTSIDNWQFPSTIDVTQVAGVGVDTLSGLKYEKGAVCNTDVMMCNDALDLEPVFSNDGDGTVLSSSAILDGTKKLYFDLKNYNDIQSSIGSKDTINHSDIFEAWPIQNLIGGLLQNGTGSFPFITQDKPQIEDTQLLVIAHSPITLDAYDSQGNHTGLVDNPDPNSDIQIVEQKIPNSTYVKFGEGKYLSLDASASTSISFQGTDYGSFTLDTSLIQNGAVIASSTFVDIPVTPEMKGSIINSTSSPVLALDIDGDGVVDATTTANQSFDPILYIEIMKKTIDSFNLKKAPEKLLIQKLDQLENKIKAGKIKNADKQIQKLTKKISRNNKKMRKITDDERNQLVVMLTNLVDNLQ